MTIEKALQTLLESENFKADARQDAKLRMFQSRHRKGEIKTGAAVEMLIRYGYTVDVRKGKVTK